MRIQEFCQARCIPVHFETMFETYVRNAYTFLFRKDRNGEAIKGTVRQLSEERILMLWLEFTSNLRGQLPETRKEKETYGTSTSTVYGEYW